MNKIYNSHILLLLIVLFNLFAYTNSYYINSYPFVLGNYVLKSSNDPELLNKYTYLIINPDDTIKLKTISQNGMVASKISRTGTLKFVKNANIFFDKNNYDNNIIMVLKYNNVNKYSYSIFGIEIPEFRYEQITDYNKNKKIKILQKSNLLYVLDNETNYYYLFDSANSIQKTILPYKEITLVTLVITQVFGFFLNLLLVHLINQ